MKKIMKSQKAVNILMIVAILFLVGRFCFTELKNVDKMKDNQMMIENLQEIRKALLVQKGNLNAQLWKLHLNRLSKSFKELKEEGSCLKVKISAWKDLQENYRWVVKKDDYYDWDKNQVEYLLTVRYFSLSEYDKNKVLRELEERLEKAKNSAKGKVVKKKKKKRNNLLQPSVLLRDLPRAV